MYSGDEKLIMDGQELPFCMLDFWRVTLSQILFNMNRGSFAEFLVRCALTYSGYDALHQDKIGIEPWDIDGPPMVDKNQQKRCCRIEVKSAASIQIDTPDDKEPYELPDTKLTFSIRKATIHSGEEPARHNDLYTFAHYKAEYKADNMLDLKFWDFYVFPTYKIEESVSLLNRTGLSLYKLKKLNVTPVSFNDLGNEIFQVVDDISRHNMCGSDNP